MKPTKSTNQPNEPATGNGSSLDMVHHGTIDTKSVDRLQPFETSLGSRAIVDQVNALDATSLPGRVDDTPTPPKQRIPRSRMLGLSLLTLGIIAAILLGVRIESNKSKAQEASLAPSTKIQQQSTQLGSLSKQLGTISPATNSGVTVNGSLVLSPSDKPSNPTAGQLFFNQTADQLQYYDGKGFVSLQGGGNTNNITNVYNNTTSGGNTSVTNVTNNINQGALTGSGTAGTLTIFGNDGNSLGDSSISEKSGVVDVASNTISIGAGSNTTTFQSNASGGISIRPEADTVAAFEVQNAAATTTLFNVDTTNSEISLGTGAGSSLGYTGSAGSTQGSAIPSGQLTAFQRTTKTAGTLTSMSVYAFSQCGAPYNLFQLSIYQDNSGSPGAYLGSTAVGQLSTSVGTGWYSLPLTAPVNVAANTPYWLAYWENCGSNTLMASNGTMSRATNQYTWQAGPDNGLPATFPSPTLDSSSLYSIYASYATSVPALTINSSGVLSQNGAAIFQDSTDSTTAFQIQNSAGSELLTADTASMIVSISGTSSSFAVLSLSNTHFSSSQTNPPTIGTPINCGTGPTAAITAGSTDTAGSFTITTGSGTPTTCDTTVTFNQAYSAAPKSVILTPTTTVGGATVMINAGESADSTTSYTVQIAPNNASASTKYSFNYLVVQ